MEKKRSLLKDASFSRTSSKLKFPALLCALILPSLAGAEDALKVKALGLRVIQEFAGEEDDKLFPLNADSSGTSVALLIESKGAALIKVDTHASEVTSFKDDAGNNLMTKPKNYNPNGFGSFPRIGKTGKFAMVEINASGVPETKSEKVEVEGTIVVQRASEKKKFKSAPFEFKKGVIVKLGDLEMELMSVEKGFNNKEELNFRTTNKKITLVAGVKFYDEAGAELKSESGDTSMWGLAKKTYTREYEITGNVEGKVVMELELWSDMKEEKLPFKIAIGVGG